MKNWSFFVRFPLKLTVCSVTILNLKGETDESALTGSSLVNRQPFVLSEISPEFAQQEVMH